MKNIEIAQKYFEYSNMSDFNKITELFSETSTYSSQNTWLYLWVVSIIEMQKRFHGSYEYLNWNIINIKEEKPWIVKIDFEFNGIKDWWKIEFSAIEYLVILDGIIQHVEIKNK